MSSVFEYQTKAFDHMFSCVRKAMIGECQRCTKPIAFKGTGLCGDCLRADACCPKCASRNYQNTKKCRECWDYCNDDASAMELDSMEEERRI